MKRIGAQHWDVFLFDRDYMCAWRSLSHKASVQDKTWDIAASGKDEDLIVASWPDMKHSIPGITVGEFKALKENLKNDRAKPRTTSRKCMPINQWFNAGSFRVTRNSNKQGLLWCIKSPAGIMLQFPINAFGEEDAKLGVTSKGYKLACDLTLAANAGAKKPKLIKLRDQRLPGKANVRKRPASAL